MDSVSSASHRETVQATTSTSSPVATCSHGSFATPDYTIVQLGASGGDTDNDPILSTLKRLSPNANGGAVSFSHAIEDIAKKTGLRRTGSTLGSIISQPFTDWVEIEKWLLLLGEPQMLWTAEQTIYALIATKYGGGPLPPTYDIRERYWPNETCTDLDTRLCFKAG